MLDGKMPKADMAQNTTACGCGNTGFLLLVGVILLIVGSMSDHPALTIYGWVSLGIAALVWFNQRSKEARLKREAEVAAVLAKRERDKRKGAAQVEQGEFPGEFDYEEYLKQQVHPADKYIPRLPIQEQPAVDSTAGMHEPEPLAGEIIVEVPGSEAPLPPRQAADVQPPPSKPPLPQPSHTLSSIFSAQREPPVPHPAPDLPQQAEEPDTAAQRILSELAPLPNTHLPPVEEAQPAKAVEGQGGFSYQPKLVSSRFDSRPQDEERDKSKSAAG